MAQVESLVRDAVIEAREVLAGWQAREAEAVAAIAQVEATSGEAYLNDPAAMEAVPKRLRELRDQVDIARSAQAAQEARVAAAESEWLTVQADKLEESLRAAQVRLEKHNAKTERLLQALVDHDGPYVTEEELAEVRNSLRPYVAGLPNSWRIPTSKVLAREVADAAKQVAAVRLLAEGVDPDEARDGFTTTPVVYPACVWGPDVLVPAPAYTRLRSSYEARIADHREAARDLADEVDDLRRRIAAGKQAARDEWDYADRLATQEQRLQVQYDSIAEYEKRLRGDQ